jgi:hypothetical protein
MFGRRLANVCTVIAAAGLIACASQSGGEGGKSPAPVTTNSESTGCGSLPVSSGPLAQSARLTLKAPGTASPGQVVRVDATVTSPAGLPRVVTTPATSALLVVSGGSVVGRALGGSGPDVPLELTAGSTGPAQAVPTSVRLAGCDSAAGTTPLPAGEYRLVGVLGYQLDALNEAPADSSAPPTGNRSFVLISAPAPITVG